MIEFSSYALDEFAQASLHVLRSNGASPAWWQRLVSSGTFSVSAAPASFSHFLPIPHAAAARGLAARTRFRAPPVHLAYGLSFSLVGQLV